MRYLTSDPFCSASFCSRSIYAKMYSNDRYIIPLNSNCLPLEFSAETIYSSPDGNINAGPCIVNVLPEPVYPYAKMVPLYPCKQLSAIG